MNYTIKELSKEQIKDIYNQWMTRHFPANEMKPLQSIFRMWDMQAYVGLGMFQEDTEELMGYAMFARVPKEPIILLDYFAMLEQFRSGGMGSVFLQEMESYLKDFNGMLLEVEDIDFAETEEEISTRKRRNAFYERAGVKDTTVKSCVFDAHYSVLYYSFHESAMISAKACERDLEAIYRIMIPGDKYDKYVSIVMP